ncbi:hypothetical protein [Mucilaginibacter aquariorum]|uniref:DUF4293 family protein n=1 Tax=Mucilaginibacter aquariorum TaxID=2967225 RepID=A0ABT1T7M3_9SPHI|nr:hypothetical protein [Mucilaginibacter aquariorum]MCQ6960617.1 hypothetical protein [Mucilaginibacter aquariorum]
MKNITKIITLVCSITLYIASLTQSGFSTDNGQVDNGPGYALVLTGWLCVSIAGISWFANPLLILSWFSFKSQSNKRSLFLSLLAFLISLSFMFNKFIIVDEGGSLHEISGYRLGYWLWLASCVLMLIGNISISVKRKETISYLFLKR